MKKQITIRARKKAAALSARQENQKHKSNFKSGPHARTDSNAGRKKPLIPDSQVVTPPAGVESEARS